MTAYSWTASAPVQAEMQTVPQHQAEEFNLTLFYFCNCESEILRKIHTLGLLLLFLQLTVEFPAFPATLGFPLPKAELSYLLLNCEVSQQGNMQFVPTSRHPGVANPFNSEGHLIFSLGDPHMKVVPFHCQVPEITSGSGLDYSQTQDLGTNLSIACFSAIFRMHQSLHC